MARLMLAAPFVLGMGMALAGCASGPDAASDATGSLAPMSTGAPKDAAAARDYWATAYAKNPHDEHAVIAFARALKADGSKDKALSVLQQAAFYSPDSLPIASEEGRIALELGQNDLAGKLLTRVNDPAHPDWRVLNALGTLEAQRDNRAGALGYFEKANEISPNQPAVLNNLALAEVLGGDAARAEALLRKAAAAGGNVARIRQNLALVLGVEGKYDEAQQLVSADLGEDKAKANRAYLETMVAATPMALGKRTKIASSATWRTAVDAPRPASEGAPVDVPSSAWVVDVVSAPEAAAGSSATKLATK